MRISTSLFFQTGLNSINQQQADLVRIFQQIGSGQRMVNPSDDPLAAAQSISLEQSRSMNARFGENRAVAMRNLGEEENILNAVTVQLQSVKTRLVEVGNGALSDSDRHTLATVLQSSLDTLVGLGNSKDGSGQYLFSGAKGDTAPFDTSSYVYNGDTTQRFIQVEQTRQLDSADHGNDIFMRANPGASVYVSSASGTNAGTGVVGAPSLDTPSVNNGATYELTFNADGTYNVKWGADELQNQALPEADKNGVRRLSLPDGASVQLSGVPQAGDSFTVELASKSGMNLFKTLSFMIEALALPQTGSETNQAQFRNILNTTMQHMDQHYDNVLTVRSSVGTRMNELDALSANGNLRNLSYRQELSRLQDVNYYEASTQLELRKSALEAAAMAFRKIQSTNLFTMNSRG
ncbi:flagellar hook-associated protein FlgL [Alcaligenes endophyticus]|uniref:Flagellar hook-associated protein FlgL n=1 Tax=Alcaligenes endophyticus TaxID=1929088 RepID=A0ABT8ELA2_9BURK|nr:flagellar hook-associated protein FlgL [Alcaligenes endophyticus]MCX5590558.1 flagellar hook-associated protein FlgL [Alcaligenes endophyticus]MDN4122078.1 flagellar hook-associated protein FlgL [Alcaligenes endophyticus]